MKKAYTTNTFTDGLLMDLNPLIAKDTTMCNALNATITTSDGNENVLQCDMGNGRVETAYLPEGYIPLGTAELGGIIYIVSYNPLIDKCQIGSFPSPERNISSDELSDTSKSLYTSNFYYKDTKLLLNCSQKLILRDDSLHPGDKFIVSSSNVADIVTGDNNYISTAVLTLTKANADLYPKYLKLSIVSVQDDGEITKLNDSLTWYDYGSVLSNTEYSGSGYYIYPDSVSDDSGNVSVDEYRNMVSSNYSVFQSKTNGKLAVLAELETIDSFEVAWDAYKNDEGCWQFYLLLNWTYDNDYARDKVNLYGVRVEQTTSSDDTVTVLCDCDLEESEDSEESKVGDGTIRTYPKKIGDGDDADDDTNDTLTHLNTIFYTPVYIKGVSTYNEYNEDPYIENGGITTPRYNDNTDCQFFFDPNAVTTETTGTITLTIIPAMPFGYMDYLKQSLSINLDLLGSGEMLLKQYKYYWQTDYVTILLGLETYPELNKEVSGVSLLFYNYSDPNTSTFIDYFKNYLGSSDIYAEICDGNITWKETSGTAISDGETYAEEGTATATYELSNRTSYSGTFAIKEEDLDNDSLYLVAIRIYYDDTIVTYYRFLYTNTIFNNYYSSVNDFIGIDLQEALDTYYPITISATSSKTKDTTTTVFSGGSETSIATYSEDETTETYTIQDATELVVTNVFSANNIVFNVTLSGCSYETDPSVSYSPEKKTQLRTSSSNELDIDDVSYNLLLNTSLSSDDSSLVVQYIINVITPLVVELSYSDSFSIQYDLVQIETVCRYLLFHVGEKSAALGICDTIAYSKNYYECDILNKDDSALTGTLKQFTTTYSALENLLKIYDAVALSCRVTTDSYRKDGILAHFANPSTLTKYITFEFAPSKKKTTYYLSCLAVMDNESQLIVLLFPELNNSKSWYGDSRITGSLESTDHSHLTNIICAQESNSGTPTSPGFLNHYYKLEDSTSLFSCYTYDSISYYDDYTVTLSLNITISASVTLCLNGSGDITSYNEIPNLHYDTTIKQTVTGQVNYQLSFDQYIESIISPSQDNLVLLPNGNVIIQELSPKCLYTYDSDTNEVVKLLYLVLPTGDEDDDKDAILSNSDQTSVGLAFTDDNIYVDRSNCYNFMLWFKSEGDGRLAVKISNVYVIN